ncbi:hypothetical protein [Coraliomargarita akajimensis]|nr:hypothetical protein [Coraliomargarita akajimensis]
MAASIGNAYSFGEPIRVLHLSPLLGYRWGGSFKNSDTGNSFDMDASPAYGLMLEHHPRGSWHKLQFGWTRQESQLSISNGGISQDRDVTVDYYHVGMQVEVPYGEHLFMTTTATIGASSFSVQNEGNDTHFFGSLGAGFKYFPGDQKRIALRGDLRGYATFIFTDPPPTTPTPDPFEESSVHLDDVFWQLEATLGLTITF